MEGEMCKECDARGVKNARTVEGVKHDANPCAVCRGSGVESGPSKGKRRFFASHQKQDDNEMSMEAQTRAFLRSKGF